MLVASAFPETKNPPQHGGESQLDYLYRLINQRLASRTSSADWYRKNNFLTQMATTALSALIAVFAGMKGSWLGMDPDVVSNIVLVLGASITVIAAYSAFFSPRELWIIDSQTSNKLRALQTRLQFRERSLDFEPNKQAVLDTAFEEYQMIMAAHNTEWHGIRTITR